MQKTMGMLGVLLAVQLVLAVSMSTTGPDLTAQRPDTPLLDLGGVAVDHLTIEGPDKQQVILARVGEDWLLPASDDFPADASKVNLLLERLKGLKRGLAVATSPGAKKRFRVSDEDFERRVLLGEGDETVATLYFGTSPGMRRVHARTGEDEAVYTTAFGTYDAPVKPEAWEDKSVLTIPQEEIEGIELGELALVRSQDTLAAEVDANVEKPIEEKTSWSGNGLMEDEMVNQGNAEALAQKLAGLTIGYMLGSEAKPEYGLDEPVLVLRVRRSGGVTIEYHFGKREKENDYVLKVSNRPEYFRLPVYSVDALIEMATHEQLVIARTGTAGEEGSSLEPAMPAEGVDPPGQSDIQEETS